MGKNSGDNDSKNLLFCCDRCKGIKNDRYEEIESR
jgi:hypothetical protein